MDTVALMSMYDTLPAADAGRINLIVERAEVMLREFGHPVSRLMILLTLVATHQVQPLDLERLVAFKDGDFAHDIAGMLRHFDHERGQLTGCFLPRCART